MQPTFARRIEHCGIECYFLLPHCFLDQQSKLHAHAMMWSSSEFTSTVPLKISIHANVGQTKLSFNEPIYDNNRYTQVLYGTVRSSEYGVPYHNFSQRFYLLSSLWVHFGDEKFKDENPDARMTYVGPSYWRRPLANGFSHLIHRVN